MPINLLGSNFKDYSFNGSVEMKLRNQTMIGYMNVIVTLSEKPFDVNNIYSRKYSAGNVFDDLEVKILFIYLTLFCRIHKV